MSEKCTALQTGKSGITVFEIGIIYKKFYYFLVYTVYQTTPQNSRGGTHFILKVNHLQSNQSKSVDLVNIRPL
ncbi:MAG: hypothetical protein Q4B04_04675 [bacterium]|nr:hypothetical protein [bacterium]